MITDVYNNLKNLVAAEFGGDYQELTHVFDIAKNRFSGSKKAYGLLPAASSEASGVTKTNTFDQGFSIVLADSYITDVISDSELIAKTLVMLEKLEELFKKIVVEKAGTPLSVINVSGFSVDSAVVAREDKVIVVEASFDIRMEVAL